MRDTAIHRLAKLSQVDSSDDPSDVEALRSEANESRLRVEDLRRGLAAVDARIPVLEELVARIRGELPVASAQAVTAGQPVCQICEVPIDRALGDGCRLSHKLPDFDAAKRRFERMEQDLAEASSRISNTLSERARLIEELHPALSDYASVTKTLRTVERMRDTRTEAWYKSRRLIDAVNRLDELLVEQQQMQARLAELENRIRDTRSQTGSFRDAHATTYNRLSQFFDAIIRELIGPDATGRVSLGGNGLSLSVELGGERSTAAIDSLKVIAFDLGAMCMSIEGQAHQPALLIHDRLREADLGLSIFHRLFNVVRRIEDMGEQPLFQYIITTTTSPPLELTKGLWLTVPLGGGAMERLLLRDL